MSSRPARLIIALALVAGFLSVAAPASAETPGWVPRAEDHPSTATTADVRVPMSDGVSLLADVVRPVDADGQVVTTPLPVIVTITAYSKTVLGSPSGATLGGADPKKLVKRGYVQVTVDARGTGSSPDVWQVFGEREQLDAAEVVEWAAAQPWSNGSVGMSGPSYMGISQLFAAGQQPEGLKAIFPQVPGGEVYRDIVASGGQLNSAFMPLWLGLVNLTGLVPPSSGTVPPEETFRTYVSRLSQGVPGSAELLGGAILGGETAHDGPFYEERSTLLQAVPTVEVPTFLVGGHYDVFQRGTPLIFQELDQRGVDVKMVLGPWDHLEASAGRGLEDAGYGTLGELQLRWFDHHVKGLPDPTLDSDIPDFTYFELGSQQWKQRDGYLTDQTAEVFRLSGTSTPLLGGGELTQGPVADGTSTLLPIPVAGLCSRSTRQWTAGVTGLLLPANPCDTDNRLNDLTGAVFETPPMTEDLPLLGPINTRLHVSSTSGDGLLAVSVSRVDAGGRVERLTGGWQVISLGELDEQRSVRIDGEIVQPWHPFTAESRRTLEPGEIAPIDVEVFPTGAVIPAGDRLRVSVQSFDVPHLLSPLPQLLSSLAVTTIHTGVQHPSQVTLTRAGGGIDAATVDAVRDTLASVDAAPPRADLLTSLLGALTRFGG
ncbi:hydrolase CocE/NonD family protein [Aeromicrobium marinum DSM 15272]|uniref:Hydrolase CocE/NonD family protein n=1 Tax=Aeromicrobium marinum DSM 15272 TaxID=585531 RepID=E2SA58_9ACTN|nr:CocE/NonD family hydrolase [Aeromicrobium marinum]EFQ84132.1 hydrolase CocE/NonD family protein [Aeromicrobium marinum DSM 15272]